MGDVLFAIIGGPIALAILCLFVAEEVKNGRLRQKRIQENREKERLQKQREQDERDHILHQLESPIVIPLHERDALPADDVQDTYRSHAP